MSDRLTNNSFRGRDYGVCLNRDFNFGARLEFDFLAVAIDQLIGDTDFAVQMVRTLHGNLRLLGFTTLRM